MFIELFFFPLLFSGYCCSVGPRVVSVCFGGCNQSASTILNVVLSCCIDASTLTLILASSHPPFLGTYSLSTSPLGCNTLSMVISFLVLCSFCSSWVHFKNGPEYLTRGTGQVFISLIRSLLYSFVSSNFLVLLKYSFSSFLSYPLVWWRQLPIFLSIWRLSFLRVF